MKSTGFKFVPLIIFCALLLTHALAEPIAAQKMSVEELIAKHLDSIGKKEKRDAVKNRLAAGKSDFESKLPSRKAVGKAVVISDANNLFYLSSFNSQEYPFEKIGFFANKISLPYVTAGTRSPLGAFINDHSKILSDGIFAGSISSSWGLLNWQNRKVKLDYAGTKKIDGRKMQVLDYFAGGSPLFTVKLFFDAETFQHVRTEYRDSITPKENAFGTLGNTSGVVISLTEDFGDFKDANGLTLPHSYKAKYTTSSSSGTYEYSWGITISQYLFNQNLAPDFFTFDEKK